MPVPLAPLVALGAFSLGRGEIGDSIPAHFPLVIKRAIGRETLETAQSEVDFPPAPPCRQDRFLAQQPPVVAPLAT